MGVLLFKGLGCGNAKNGRLQTEVKPCPRTVGIIPLPWRRRPQPPNPNANHAPNGRTHPNPAQTPSARRLNNSNNSNYPQETETEWNPTGASSAYGSSTNSFVSTSANPSTTSVVGVCSSTTALSKPKRLNSMWKPKPSPASRVSRVPTFSL
jgi:hypothetical protein